MEKDITLAMHLEEDAKNTTVTAKLDIRGDHFEATARARRNPDDENIPVIGEELAVARVLGKLHAEVLESAQDKIDRLLD